LLLKTEELRGIAKRKPKYDENLKKATDGLMERLGD
jgi:hypothetical protein